MAEGATPELELEDSEGPWTRQLESGAPALDEQLESQGPPGLDKPLGQRGPGLDEHSASWVLSGLEQLSAGWVRHLDLKRTSERLTWTSGPAALRRPGPGLLGS